MPAVSKKQQQQAGIELKARESGASKSKGRPMGNMSTKDLRKLAETKHEGLPARKK